MANGMQAIVETDILFSNEQLSGVPFGSLAQTGSAFTNSLNSAPSTIDSSTSDHMTNQSHLFSMFWSLKN